MSAAVSEIQPTRSRMCWDRDAYLPQELSDHAYLITWEQMSSGRYYRAYTPGGRLLDCGGGEKGLDRCRRACEQHLASGRRAI